MLKIVKSHHQIMCLIISTIIILFMLFPIIWLITSSLLPSHEVFKYPPKILPHPPFLFRNYIEVFTAFPFAKIILNSFIVSCISVGIQLILSTTAAYALSRIKFNGRNFIFILILAGLMIPSQTTIIPQFIFLSKLKLLNSLTSLIITSIAFPLGVFLIRQFMMTIPISYDESAYLDGANRQLCFFYIILPMIKSALIISGLFHFLAVWNDFFKPLIFINSNEYMTLPLGLYTLRGYMGNGSISVILAGVFVSIIPSFILYLWGQRYLLQGAVIGGIKS